MWKNYLFAALNVAVSGLGILLGWDLFLYSIYCAFAILLIALTAWNTIGDWCVILFAFHAKRVPQEALMMPALQRYLSQAVAGDKFLRPGCKFYYAESRIPYFIPISRKKVVLSLALEDYLIQDRNGSLYRDVPLDAYIPKVVFSRKVLLVSILCYVLILRFLEIWAIVAVAILKFCGAVIVVIVTGGFWEGIGKLLQAIWIGMALGALAWKINEFASCLQDKAVDFLMKRTMQGTFDYLKKSGMPAGRGIRLGETRREC